MDERKRSLRKEIVRLALPIALQQFMTALVGACDAIMLGKLSQDAMSAVSLATQVTFVFNLFMFAFMAGENMFVAQYYGKGDYTGISQVFSLVTKICGCIAVVFLAGTLFFPEQLMRILTNEETLIVLGSEYLRVSAFPCVFGNCTDFPGNHEELWCSKYEYPDQWGYGNSQYRIECCFHFWPVRLPEDGD